MPPALGGRAEQTEVVRCGQPLFAVCPYFVMAKLSCPDHEKAGRIGKIRI